MRKIDYALAAALVILTIATIAFVGAAALGKSCEIPTPMKNEKIEKERPSYFLVTVDTNGARA